MAGYVFRFCCSVLRLRIFNFVVAEIHVFLVFDSISYLKSISLLRLQNLYKIYLLTTFKCHLNIHTKLLFKYKFSFSLFDAYPLNICYFSFMFFSLPFSFFFRCLFLSTKNYCISCIITVTLAYAFVFSFAFALELRNFATSLLLTLFTVFLPAFFPAAFTNPHLYLMFCLFTIFRVIEK